jgi:hypothetical protein
MANLKCEYPDGCMLDLWAYVIKAKYIAKQVKILDTLFCVTDSQVGGKISAIDDIKVKVIDKGEDFQCYNKVRIYIDYEIILFVIVNGEYQIVTVNDRYEQDIELDEFDPPLTIEEFRNEIEHSEIAVKHWNFDYEILGNCEDRLSPCRHHPHEMEGPEMMERPDCHEHGTCLGLKVYADIIDKLGKMHDVIVYGELDPEIES